MNRPHQFDRALIPLAAQRIASHVRQTPLLDCVVNGINCQFKLEFLQISGTFKARGAFNCLLSGSPEQHQRGVVAASGGNHGIAVAYAAKALGLAAHIFVPQTVAQAKRDRLQALAATIHPIGEQYAQALQASEQFAQRQQMQVAHAYDQIETVAGQGTVAAEWETQWRQNRPDTVLVAVGGGGLIGGIAAWFDNRVKVVAVEPVSCPSLHQALQAGQPVDVAVGGIAADSLGAKQVGTLMFPIAQRAVANAVLVSDDAIRAAQQYLWRELRIATEPGGATALAALLSRAYVPAAGERIGVLLCGANVDPASLAA